MEYLLISTIPIKNASHFYTLNRLYPGDYYPVLSLSPTYNFGGNNLHRHLCAQEYTHFSLRFYHIPSLKPNREIRHSHPIPNRSKCPVPHNYDKIGRGVIASLSHAVPNIIQSRSKPTMMFRPVTYLFFAKTSARLRTAS